VGLDLGVMDIFERVLHGELVDAEDVDQERPIIGGRRLDVEPEPFPGRLGEPGRLDLVRAFDAPVAFEEDSAHGLTLDNFEVRSQKPEVTESWKFELRSSNFTLGPISNFWLPTSYFRNAACAAARRATGT